MRAGIGFCAILILSACGDSSPPPASPSTSSSSSGSTPKTSEALPKTPAAPTGAAQLDALTAGEAKSGTCDPEHAAALEKLLGDVEAAAKTDGYDLVSKRTLALSENSRGVEMTVSGKGTEIQVVAYSAKDVSMDVLAGTGAASTMRSPLAKAQTLTLPKAGTTELHYDSRQVTIKPGQPLQVKMTGQGCAALISVVKR